MLRPQVQWWFWVPRPSPPPVPVATRPLPLLALSIHAIASQPGVVLALALAAGWMASARVELPLHDAVATLLTTGDDVGSVSEPQAQVAELPDW